MPASFEVFGCSFRSVDPGTVPSVAQGSISVVWESKCFPEDSVQWLTQSTVDRPAMGLGPDVIAYRFASGSDYILARDGSMLRIFVGSTATHADLQFELYRGVIPRLLHLRGITCLHGSAVCGRDGVVAFLGESGAGKSTVAAALVACGFPLLTDDCLPLRGAKDGDAVMAGPGLPELRLYFGAAELAGVAADLAPPGPGQTKGVWIPPAQQTERRPAPLAALYLLRPRRRRTDGSPAARLSRPLPRRQAMLDLIASSFWSHVTQTTALASDMVCLARVAYAVPVRRLLYEAGPEGLAAAIRLIGQEAASHGPGGAI